jgi:hypothetical protein
MPFDYTDAPPPSFDLIPDGTVATVSINIRAGGVGEDGMLKRSNNGQCEMLDLEFIVLDGTYKNRRFWNNLILEGTTDGQKKMAIDSVGMLKAILDSALGLLPTDVSPEARAARTVSVKAFHGMSFIAKIGVERGGPKKEGGTWPDKNCLAGVITKDKKEWHPVEQPPPFNGGGGSGGAPSAAPSAAPIQRPDWAGA